MSAISIRMYNVGFGDCFLVRVAGDGAERKILFDCGSHPSGPGPWPIADVARSIVDELGAHGTPRLDVIVATHRHADHISGFDPGIWSRVEVGEVWLPWVEDRDDPQAQRIRAAQQHLAAALMANVKATRSNAATLELLANATSNDAASQLLLSGFAGNPIRRYLPVAGGPDTFASPVLPGISVHVLGPSRDPAVIRDINPPNSQSYLASLGLDLPAGEDGRLLPFAGLGTQLDPAKLPKELAAVADAAGFDQFDLAVALEDAINGTSLMLVLEVGANVLLFPGDAQWGTWQVAMANRDWVNLLRRLTFLKVGHHGSHNATPVEFVDKYLPHGIHAMCSTRHMDRWPRIPRAPLLDALVAKGTDLIRSDQLAAAPRGYTVGPDRRWAELEL